MPHPVYLMCSQSGSVDSASRHLSFFDVISSIKIKRVVANAAEEGSSPSVSPLTMRIVASWMQEEGDSERKFEAEFSATFPKEDGTTEEVVFSNIPFVMPTLFRRLILPSVAVPGFHGPGILWIQCRVRQTGETEWLAEQKYPIALVAESDKPPPTE